MFPKWYNLVKVGESTYSWETREQFKLVLIESSESALVIGHLKLTFELTFFYPVREVFIEIK